MEFKWDKNKFGDLTPEVESLINQAISFGKKELGAEKDNLINELSQTNQILQEQLKSFEININLDKELEGISNDNKNIIKDLIGNDLNKLNDIKSKYSHLFIKEIQTNNLEDLIKNGTSNELEKDLNLSEEELKAKIESGKASTEEELKYYEILNKKFNT